MKGSKPTVIGVLTCGLSIVPCTWSATLEEVVRSTLNTHPKALESLSKIRAQEKNVNVAWAGYLPTLDVAAGIGGQQRDLPDENANPQDGKTYTRKEGSVTFKHNLFSGFNTWHKVDQARYKLASENHQLNATLEELALDVTEAYLKVLELGQLTELAEDNLKFHDAIYQQIKKRTQQGVARSSDLAQVEGRKARAAANVINNKNNLANAKSEYYSLVGRMPKDLLQPYLAALTLPTTLEAALSTSVKMHPGLMATRFEIQSAEANYASQKSGYYPALDIEVNKSWKTNADGQLNTVEDFVAMTRVRYNLFRGGADWSRVQESAYRVEGRRTQQDQLLRNIEEALRVAWASYTFLGEQLPHLRQHEDASRKTVAAYREQFQIGKRTLLDLLDTENELFQSSQALISTLYQEAFSRYRIMSAMGQLLAVFKLKPTSL